ncbi:MAG: hypothetical protein AB7F39_06685 [Variibacter sp.]
MDERGNVISVRANMDAIKLAEEALHRLKSGRSCALAVVLVDEDGCVTAAWSRSTSYHQLNSGAARLAARIALQE